MFALNQLILSAIPGLHYMEYLLSRFQMLLQFRWGLLSFQKCIYLLFLPEFVHHLPQPVQLFGNFQVSQFSQYLEFQLYHFLFWLTFLLFLRECLHFLLTFYLHCLKLFAVFVLRLPVRMLVLRLQFCQNVFQMAVCVFLLPVLLIH